MKTLLDFVERVKSADVKVFAEANPGGFLVYNLADGPLSPVDASQGATLMRPPLNQRADDPTGMLEMFAVYELGEAALTGITIGSGDECDVVVNDETASRRHALLTVRERDLEVKDLGSTLGTQVGHSTLDADQTGTVEAGTSFTLGSVELRYLPADRFQLLVTQMAGRG